MADPSQSIHERMFPHLHLVSTFRYPLMPHVSIQDVIKWLQGAPKIARDTAPFFWTYLDTPADGTIMLTWQPEQRMGTNFASDGYVWPAAETYYTNDAGNGLMLEMFHQRAGYRQGEQFATHSRRRFRLVPTPNVVPGAPQVDRNLWIVHYGPNDPQDRMPANMMPVSPAIQSMMHTRMQLQRGGQIARKEFMLADRLNWPTINPPREGRGHPMIAQHPSTRNIPQQLAYPPGPPHPPGKRQRTAAHAAQQHTVAAGAHSIPLDDEEDTSAGDMFDHMTPRDVSMARYTRNHEWMEEVLGSAYRIGQITPSDLGLGLQGELTSVTQGIFEPSGVDAHKKPPTKPVVGHLDPGLADQFRKRVADKIEADNAEMARMKAQHETQMAEFKSNLLLMRAEKELRVAVDETGPEFWRLEGKEEDDDESADRSDSNNHRKVDDIVSGIESALGRHIAVVRDVKRIQNGGYQQPAPEPEPLPVPPTAPATGDASVAGPSHLSRQPSRAGSQNSGVMIGDSDIDMGGTAAGLVGQMQGGMSSNSTPQPHLSTIPSAVATPANVAAPSPQPTVTQAHAHSSASEDVTMKDSDQAKAQKTAPDQGTGSGDWIVVPKGGVSPGASASGAPAPALATAPAAYEGAQTPSDATKPGGNNDFGSLDDMNSAGEALNSYDQAAGGTDLGDDMDIGGDFADAMFGAGESRDSAADTPADGTI